MMQTTPSEITTLSGLLQMRAQHSPEAPAYRQFVDGRWVDYTWGDTRAAVGRWQAALRKEGLKRGDRVALCLKNRYEWVLFDQAALGLGLVTVPLYFKDRADNMAWCVNDAGVRLLLLEDGGAWSALRPDVKMVERVVCLTQPPENDAIAVGLDAWLPEGEHIAVDEAAAHELATIVYTSGTTGRPKGVMLTHDNIVSNVFSALDAVPIVRRDDRFLSFLPLSHMFERTASYYLAMSVGAQVIYARSVQDLADDMREQQPTVLVSVPLIFERIYAKMQDGLPPGSFKRRVFERAVAGGWRRFLGKATIDDRLLAPILHMLVARKLHARLGGRLRLVVSGAAAFSPELARVFIGLGLTIVQGYGLTEFSPVVCANRVDDNDPFSVGRPVKGTEIKIATDGQLLVRGRACMVGYWNNPVATRAAIDEEGWLHTGDLVEVRDGRVYIKGRAKDIIVLSNGEKVPPADAERAILLDPAFQQVMVIGEGRPGLGIIAVTNLSDEREICQRANEQLRAFPGYARIRYVVRAGEPWSIESGLLTPTLKLRRHMIEQCYRTQIEDAYKRKPVANNHQLVQ
jgi:long-chain acyl-CoA synthetase